MATSAVVGLLRVLLTANTAEYETAMKRSADSAKAWTKELNSIGQQATKVGTALTKTLTLPLVALGAGSVKAAMDFESSFANVAKTVDGVSDKTGKLTKAGEGLAMAFRQMAKEIPATTDELTAIAALGGQMGVPIQSLEKFTKNVAALGVAVDGISTEEAASGLAQIANVFGDKQVQNVDKMASALVHLGNSSNATEADILEFSKRLAGAGNAAGLSVPEVMALGTAMANVGLNAEAGGTAMSTMIAKMSSAVSEGGQALDAFAKVARMSAEEFAATWRRSPIEAIDAVVKGLSFAKASGQDLNLVVKEIGATNIRTADTMKRLAGAGDGVSSMLKVANEGFTAGNKHLEEAEKKYATTANQLQILWNQIRDVGITIGNALLPAIKSMIGFMGNVIPIVDSLAKGFALLPGSVQAIAVGMGLLAAAAGPMIFIFGQLAISAAALTTTFTAQGISTKLLVGHADKLGKAWLFLQTPITMTTVKTAALTLAQKAHFAATSSVTIATTTLAGAATKLWAVLAAHPFVAVTAAIGLATVALTKFIEKRAQAALDAETAAAKQDTINNAIKRGAAANISYADAVKYLEERHKGDMAATLFWAQAQRDAEKGIFATVDSTNKAGSATKTFASELAAARKELAGMSKGDLADLTLAIQHNADSAEKLAERYKVSELAVKLLSDRMKDGTKATKEAESAAEKHAKAVEKQREALEKLGIVTDQGVNQSLQELAEMEMLALSGGAKYNAVMAAMLPMLEALQAKAVASGVGVDKIASALERAKKGAEAFNDELRALVPALPLIAGGIGDVGTKIEIVSAETALSAQGAKVLTDAYHSFGLKTREELQQLAREAEQNYQIIAGAVGKHAPEAIEAYKKMIEAQKAASRELPSVWQTEIIPSIKGAINAITSSMSDAFAGMLDGGESFRDAFTAIWESIKRSVVNVFADILDAFINGLLKRMIGALVGQKGAFSGGFGGLLSGLFGGGVGPTVASAMPGIALPLPTAPAVGGAAGAAGGFLSSGLGTALGGVGIGAGGFGLGMLLSDKFGKTAGTIGGGAGGAGIGALLGTMLFPGIGTGIGALIGGLGGVIGGLFGAGNKGRSTVEGFAESMGGFDALHKKLSELGQEGENLWKTLTQGVGRNNKDQAIIAINKVTEALERHKQKTLETASATEEAAQREQAARQAQMDALQGQLDELDRESESLMKSIADEAPEEVMGVVEAQQRARMEQIKTERAVIAEELAHIQAEAEAAAIATAKRIEEILGSLHIRVPVTFTMPEGPPSFDPGSGRSPDPLPSFATGTHGQYVDFGRETLVKLHGREKITPEGAEGGSGSTTVILEVDRREFARAVVPVVPGEARRLGVRVRH